MKVREIANYLSLVDRFYGRLFARGVYAYGHQDRAQLEFAEIRSGSIEAIIREVIDDITSKQNLVIVFLLIKYLPNIIKFVKKEKIERFFERL